jgi:hypothetical protein
MKIGPLCVLGAAALVLSTLPSYSGPCSQQIERFDCSSRANGKGVGGDDDPLGSSTLTATFGRERSAP